MHTERKREMEGLREKDRQTERNIEENKPEIISKVGRQRVLTKRYRQRW